MRKQTIGLLVLVFLVFVVSAAAVKHQQQYEVGTFVGLQYVDAGSVTQGDSGGIFGGGNARTRNLGHNAAVVDAPEGRYLIQPPTSTAALMLFGGTVDPSKQWFVDSLHPGDKLVFASTCDKHNNCTFQVPNPDRPGKVYVTTGSILPAQSKSNTQSLCGTGKLTPDAEAQLCGSAYDAPTVTAATVTAATATAATRAAEVSQTQTAGQAPTKQATATAPPVQAPAQALADATPIPGQDAPKKVEMQCRNLADAYNIVGPDEVLVDGKVCKRVKQAAPNP